MKRLVRSQKRQGAGRTPRRWRDCQRPTRTRSVLDCGGPPPLSPARDAHAATKHIVRAKERQGAAAPYPHLPQTNQSRSDWHGSPRIPKGFRPKAQGCPEILRSYLGSTCNQRFQPQRGCGQGRPWQGNGKGRNRVAVDDFIGTRTQGRLADSPTLGWRTQSLWDCQNGRASGLQDTCKVHRISVFCFLLFLGTAFLSPADQLF